VIGRTSTIIKEACVESYHEAVEAFSNGADRLEVCSRLDLDGLTPDKMIVEKIIQKVNLPVKVMIRPRGGDFNYTNTEIDKMCQDIKHFKDLSLDGIVIGVLDSNYKIDMSNLLKLCEKAFPLKITFHKAIDQTNNIIQEVRKLSQIKKIHSILTSGGKPNANLGKEIIKSLIKTFSTDIDFIVAGSITSDNFDMIHKLIGANEYHGKNIVGKKPCPIT
tara:strand:+ start:119 stop:775 length:657 start_codon:yes stop_codon:yes gene_type:complete